MGRWTIPKGVLQLTRTEQVTGYVAGVRTKDGAEWWVRCPTWREESISTGWAGRAWFRLASDAWMRAIALSKLLPDGLEPFVRKVTRTRRVVAKTELESVEVDDHRQAKRRGNPG